MSAGSLSVSGSRAQRSELPGINPPVLGPEVIADQIDLLPPHPGEVLQQIRINLGYRAFECLDRTLENLNMFLAHPPCYRLRQFI